MKAKAKSKPRPRGKKKIKLVKVELYPIEKVPRLIDALTFAAHQCKFGWVQDALIELRKALRDMEEFVGEDDEFRVNAEANRGVVGGSGWAQVVGPDVCAEGT